MEPENRSELVDGFAEAASPLALSRTKRIVKRSTDLAVATTGLVLLAPVLLAIAAAIKLTSPGPVFFRQVRVGANSRRFHIYKFRTMAVDADERKSEYAHLNAHAADGGDPRMFKIIDDPRVTPFGRFLRRYFLDELPQLINVFKGEMSLVGPRPLIVEEDEEVPDWARRRLSMRPGMTGTWQVLGHSRVPFAQMIELDCDYVSHWTFRRDLSLVAETIPLVLRGDGEGR